MELAEQASNESFAVSGMIRQQLKSDPPIHLIEWTISYTRVLLEFTKGHCPEEAPKFFHVDQPGMISREKIIPCRYDGPDLERVARHCGCTLYTSYAVDDLTQSDWRPRRMSPYKDDLPKTTNRAHNQTKNNYISN